MGKCRANTLMGKVFVLAVIFLIFKDIGVNGKKIPTASKEADRVVERLLKKINKPAVKSIQSADGDIIDCVDIHKQPAFDHALLKNHVLQMKPSSAFVTATVRKNSTAPPPERLQLWRRNGSCPEGTVPIRRVTKAQILRSRSHANFGRKTDHYIYHPNSTKDAVNDDYNTDPTAVLFTAGYNYIGAAADINLWNPYVESDDEYSSGQIWLRSGPFLNFVAIESGWIVYPQLYGDRRTRFFIYWTHDGSKTTGCFDLICAGFVHLDKDISLGAAFAQTSTILGYQFVLPLNIAVDPNTGHWWLQYDGKLIGYWPSEMFENAFPLVVWGGQVKTKKTQNPHTATAMGSGRLGTSRYGLASFMANIEIRDYSMSWKFPHPHWLYGNQYDCYTVDFSTLPSDPNFFYYGGPGRWDRCP